MNDIQAINSSKLTARMVGALFILAAVTSIIGLALYGVILKNPNYVIQGSVNEIQVAWGAFLETVLAFSLIGISVLMFPILKKHNESLALGYVCFRLLEATIIVIGIISLLSIITLNHEFAKAATRDTSPFLTASKLLVAVHDWTFLFGPNLALGPSTLMMSYLLYRSKLVPRFIAVLGLVGGPLIFASAVLVMFGVYLQISVWGVIAALPVFAYEMSLAVWLMVKGFNAPAISPALAK
jgi:hypothetical protein